MWDLLAVATTLRGAIEAVRRQRDRQSEPLRAPGSASTTNGPPPGFAEGVAWDALVSRMKALFAEWGISTGARNDDLGVSPFVSFLSHIQKHFPPESRRHNQSQSALAKAISRSKRSSGPVNRTRTAAEWLDDYWLDEYRKRKERDRK